MEINLNIPTAAEWMRLCPSQISFVFSKYYSENKDKVVNNWNNFVQSANNGTILDQALIAKWTFTSIMTLENFMKMAKLVYQKIWV